MKQIVLTRFGPPQNLVLQKAPPAEPGPGQVRIAVRHAGINFADIHTRMGMYPGSPRPPFVPGLEAAGEIDRVGPGVSRAPGERVCALMHCGAYAQFAVVPEVQALPVPHAMTFEEAAAFPVNYLTAWGMIVGQANLRSGERILVHMAAGGVGLAALQIARSIGAEIFATASASKHSIVREMGAHHAIDYRTEDFENAIVKIAGDRPLDVVLDPLGGKATRKNYRLLREGGRLIVFGFARAVTGWKRGFSSLLEYLAIPRFHPLSLMRDNITVAGFHLGRMRDPSRLGPGLDALAEMYRAGKIRPVVGKTFPLEQAAEAHRYIQRRENTGKVLLSA